MMRDDEVMLMALSKERERLHDEIMQVDRIIKKIKNKGYLVDDEITAYEVAPVKQLADSNTFPIHANIKVQLLKVFDLLGSAVKLKDIQTEYTKQTGKVYVVRDHIRNLNANRLVLAIKEKDANRSFY